MEIFWDSDFVCRVSNLTVCGVSVMRIFGVFVIIVCEDLIVSGVSFMKIFEGSGIVVCGDSAICGISGIIVTGWLDIIGIDICDKELLWISDALLDKFVNWPSFNWGCGDVTELKVCKHSLGIVFLRVCFIVGIIGVCEIGGIVEIDGDL